MGYCPNGSLVCRRKMQRLGAECASDAVSSWSSVNLTSSLWIHHQRPSGWALEAASRPIPWGRCVSCRRKMQRLVRNLFRFRRSVILVTCESHRARCGYTISSRVDGLWRPHHAPSRGEGVCYVDARCNDWAGICSASDAVSSWSPVRLPELTVDTPSSSEWMGSGGRISPHPVGKVYFLKHLLHCTYLRCSA